MRLNSTAGVTDANGHGSWNSDHTSARWTGNMVQPYLFTGRFADAMRLAHSSALGSKEIGPALARFFAGKSGRRH